MKIFAPLPADHVEMCHPVDHTDFEEVTKNFAGLPLGNAFKSVQMEIVREDEGKTLVQSDVPWFGSNVFVFRSHRIEKIRNFLTQFGELLPVECQGESLEFYNVTNVVDALNEDASDVARFSGGDIFRVEKYVFHLEALKGQHVFKIPNLRVSPIYLDEGFVTTWKEHGLSGLDFEELWVDG